MKKYTLPLVPVAVILMAGIGLYSVHSSPSDKTLTIKNLSQPKAKNSPDHDAFLTRFHHTDPSIENKTQPEQREKETTKEEDATTINKTSMIQNLPQDTLNTESDEYTNQDSSKLKAEEKSSHLGNQKPKVNKEIHQKLQTMLYALDLTQSTPINLSFNISGLFYDEEDDFITTRIYFSYPGLSLINKNGLTLVGSPIKNEKETNFIISAKDDHHGEGEEAWTHIEFTLPSIEDAATTNENALVGEIIYRLETTNSFLGQDYDYDVVYCEAFKFINDTAFYASSTNKQTCPTEKQLTQIGNYQADEQQLILTSTHSSFDADQHWQIKLAYESSEEKGESLLTTVHNGKQFETYTILKNKQAMESRLNVVTGEYPYQMEKFEYFFPTDKSGNYIKGTTGMYMMNSRLIDPSWAVLDSDLNINSDTHDMRCSFVLPFYQSSILGGQGAYASITTSSTAPNNIDPIECEERINANNQKRFAYLDLDYSYYDELVDGGIYSYVLKPKPEFAHLVEEFKVNLIYHAPTFD